MIDSNVVAQDAAYYTWTIDNNKSGNIVSISEFYIDAAAGTLPNLTYLTPTVVALAQTPRIPPASSVTAKHTSRASTRRYVLAHNRTRLFGC